MILTTFYAKSWYIVAAAILFSVLTLFCVVLGPLFLFGILKNAAGRPVPVAGIAMSIIAVPFGLIAVLGWFNVYARRRPLLRICVEGLEINVIGASRLDGVPLIPNMVRVAWLVLSLEGFRKQVGWIPWKMLRGVEVSGVPMIRSLEIDATIIYPTSRGEEISARIGNHIAFADVEFQDRLETIAAAIETFAEDPTARSELPSLYR